MDISSIHIIVLIVISITCEIVANSSLYYRGNTNNWGKSPMTLISENIWEISLANVANTTGIEFKLDVKGDWSEYFEQAKDANPASIPQKVARSDSPVSTTLSIKMVPLNSGCVELQFNELLLEVEILSCSRYEGYYVDSTDPSSDLMECPFGANSCVTVIEGLETTCTEGYEGNGCSMCSEGYFREYGLGSDGCSECTTLTRSAILISALTASSFFLVLNIAFMLVKHILTTTDSSKYLFVACISKILLSHLQVTALIGEFDLPWPVVVSVVFNTIGGVVNWDYFYGKNYSIECLIKPYVKGAPIPVINLGSLIMMIIMFCGLFVFTWFILFTGMGKLCSCGKRRSKLRKKKKKEVPITNKGKFAVSLIVFFYMLYPSMVKNGFNLFPCKTFTNEFKNRMISDLQIKCFGSEHMSWLFILGLPWFLVFLLGLPLLSFISLCRKQNNMEFNLTDLGKYDFLFRGYKRKFWFWEIFVTLRKIGLVSLLVFTTFLTVEFKIISILSVLSISLLFQAAVTPYEDYKLNALETLSLLCNLITINVINLVSEDIATIIILSIHGLWIFGMICVMMCGKFAPSSYGAPKKTLEDLLAPPPPVSMTSSPIPDSYRASSTTSSKHSHHFDTLASPAASHGGSTGGGSDRLLRSKKAPRSSDNSRASSKETLNPIELLQQEFN